MEHVFKHEQLPSGKVIIRHFGEDGSLLKEQHTYGALDIGISYAFKGGIKVDETYFAKRRMVSRRTYEKARTAYADMPPADVTLDDTWGQLLRVAAKDRKQRSLAAKQHQADPEEAQKIDAFCLRLLEKGRREDAVSWVKTKKHTLGERSWSSSKRLVERLSALGCVQIYACEIDAYQDGLENTGHLVVELPTEPAARSKIMRALGRLASETGYDGDLDDGQRYEYVKLD